MSNSSDNQTTIASGVVTGLAVVCVALRFYARFMIKVGVGWDDWWVLIGLLLLLLAGAFLLWGQTIDPTGDAAVEAEILNPGGTGFDTYAHETYLQLFFVSSVLYFSIASAVKVSILLMYRRIFSASPRFRLHSLIVGGFVVAWWLAATVATLLNCRPLKYSWIGLSPVEYCFNYNVFWMATGVLEVLLDAVILALPVRMVLTLQLSKRKKSLILFVFLLGGFVLVTGILRVAYSYIPGSRVPSYGAADFWSAVHVGMGIVCASLPPLWPLLVRASTSLAAASCFIRRRKYGFRSSSYGPSPGPRNRSSGGRWSGGGGGGGAGSGGARSRQPVSNDDDPIESLPLRRPPSVIPRGDGEESACSVP